MDSLFRFFLQSFLMETEEIFMLVHFVCRIKAGWITRLVIRVGLSETKRRQFSWRSCLGQGSKTSATENFCYGLHPLGLPRTIFSWKLAEFFFSEGGVWKLPLAKGKGSKKLWKSGQVNIKNSWQSAIFYFKLLKDFVKYFWQTVTVNCNWSKRVGIFYQIETSKDFKKPTYFIYPQREKRKRLIGIIRLTHALR